MNLKNLFPKRNPFSKTPQPSPRLKKSNAHIKRATMSAAEDYDSEEPNVRLSRAFIVVMLLHVVAVGGIFAFSSLKKSTPAPIEPAVTETETTDVKLPAGSSIYSVRESDTVNSIASSHGITRQDLETSNESRNLASLQPGDKLIIPAKSTAQAVPVDVQKLLQLSKKNEAAATTKNPIKPAVKSAVAANPPGSSPSTEDKIYIVEKGDNPVGIAKKNGISYAALVEANKITDPRKLQIGQRLVIPHGSTAK